MALCPCSSEKEFEACCRPYINGTENAPTAEALMRSRYTAFATGAVEYIGQTIAPDKKKDFDEKSVADWSQKSTWHGLEIKSTRAGTAADTTGDVEFIAHYSTDGTKHDHHEKATFRKEGGKWYFVDGNLLDQKPFRRPDVKVGRNDPCSCGSGKKFKKCCGVAKA
jgi:SEC-C motif-containing protein